MSVLSTCINAYIQGKKIVFFGAGAEGSVSLLHLRNAGSLVSYIVDNSANKQGTKLHDISIYHPDVLMQENKTELQIIITAVDYSSVARQLQDMGFSEIYATTFKDANEKIPTIKEYLTKEAVMPGSHEIDCVRDLFSDEASKKLYSEIVHKRIRGIPDYSDICSSEPMYFNDIFSGDMTQDEVYIDAGVHTASTIIDFIFYTKGKYKKIYAFEPDPASYNRLSRDLPYIQNVVLSKCGLSNVDDEVSFIQDGTGGSRILKYGRKHAQESAVKIKVVKLDTFLKEIPTFIKMDIEGAEYDALVGAGETIKRYKPKLAISIYHNYSDDLVKIPLLVHEIVPEYKFYLKHHAPNYFETVLYAKV